MMRDHTIPGVILKSGILVLALILCAGCKKPDLVLKAVYLEPNSRMLIVQIANKGEGKVPEGKGNLKIFVDGFLAEEYRLADLADKAFINPGGTTTVYTKLRMGHPDRRVAVVLDSDNEIEESDEYRNTRTYTFTPERPGPDLVISDAYEENNRLTLVVANIGSGYWPAGRSVKLTVFVNGGIVVDRAYPLPALNARRVALINLDPSIHVEPASRVRALLAITNPSDETDNTNNELRERLLGKELIVQPYLALLADPRLAKNIIWESSSGVRKYPAWSTSQKNDLRDAILRYELQNTQVPSKVPPFVRYEESRDKSRTVTYISERDAWDVYVAHVAHALWVEVHNAVPWHLADFPKEQLACLLDSRKLIKYYSATDEYGYHASNIGTIVAWNPRISYEFLSNLKLLKPTHIGTIYALTDWMRGHLGHMGGDETNLVQFDYAGSPPADRILYPINNRGHRVRGCWCTTGLYSAVLRGVNIPVQPALTIFEAKHSRPYFPSVDRSMPHADDPYGGYPVPSGNVIPVASLFYTAAQMEAKFLNPPVDCNGGRCNTVCEQATYNHRKALAKLGYEYRVDFMLWEYAKKGPEYLDAEFRGVKDEDRTVDAFVKPFFPASERAKMISGVEASLKTEGGGDLERGKARVIERWENR